MSPAVVPRMDKVYLIVRKIYGRSPTDDLNDLDENNGYMSWARLYGECTIYQESTLEVCKTVIPSD